MTAPLEYALKLLGRASDDLWVLRQLLSDPRAPGWVLGFHAQQGVEKALKAILSAQELAYPRTHNLVMRAELLRGAGIGPPPDADDFGRLIPYGVTFRYEDATGDEPPTLDPEWLEAVVARTVAWAAARLDRKED